MEPTPSFSRQRKPSSSSSDRFLTLFSHSPPSTGALSSTGDELSEDDVFWNGESSGPTSPVSSCCPSTSSNSPANRNHRLSSKSFGRADNFGILAVLPELDQETNKNWQISAASALPWSSASSSSRMIPIIPRPPPERTLSASMKHHQYQSAPVNVPLMPRDDFERYREGRLLEENDHLEEEDEGEMLPPHEIVAKQSVKSQIISCSVLEGAGRTLKGRDLRRVRNAVFRQTGFLD